MEKCFLVSMLLVFTSTFFVEVNGWWEFQFDDRIRVGHGESCSTSIKCNQGAWLSCQNEICKCVQPEKMMYNKQTRKCVSKTGERCRFAISQGDDDRIIYDVMGCDINASCTADGICTCNDRFYENSNGTCVQDLGHREPCRFHEMCSIFQGLQCDDGECKCDKFAATYSDNPDLPGGPHCVGLAEKTCSIHSQCVEDAHCDLDNYNCVCQPSFYPNSEGRCLPKVEYFGTCTQDNQCLQAPGQHYVCLNGVCNCNPNISTFATVRALTPSGGCSEFVGFDGPELSQCVGLADLSCIDSLCVHNAFCSFSEKQETYILRQRKAHRSKRSPWSSWEPTYEEEMSTPSPRPSITKRNPNGVCRCMPGFTKSKSGACSVPINSECASSSDCIDGLLCRSSRCQCRYKTQIYDSSTYTCVSKAGGPCGQNSTFSCGQYAECKPIDPLKNGVGHCVCLNGFNENNDGHCITGHQTACRSTAECDTFAQLECIDNVCDCAGFAEYKEELGKCVGLVGAKCDPSKKNECTENSHCTLTETKSWHKLLLGSCSCDKGYQEIQNYTCQLI